MRRSSGLLAADSAAASWAPERRDAPEWRCVQTPASCSGAESSAQRVLDTFELASSAQQSYRFGNPASRRELAIRLCSNWTVAAKEVSVEPYFPLRIIAERHLVQSGGIV